jgi:cell division protein ZipA
MEADGLRWSLLIIGSLVIIGLAVHGIWLSRKNSDNKLSTNNHKKDQQYQPSGWQSDTDRLDQELNFSNNDTDEDVDVKFDIGVDEVETNLSNTASSNTASSKHDFDDLGIGAVRVVSSDTKEEVDIETAQIPTIEIQCEPDVPPSKIYASVVTQPKPEYASKYGSSAAQTVGISQQERATSNKANVPPKVIASPFTGAANNTFSTNNSYQAPEPPPFLLKKDLAEPESINVSSILGEEPIKTIPEVAPEKKEVDVKPHATLGQRLSLSEQARNLVKRKKAESLKKPREPKIAEDQMRIDFDDQPTAKPEPKEATSVKSAQSEEPQEVLVLNVKSADDNPIPGSALLPMLLTLGFKFGDQDIFHRHVNSNGKGPVLFSLANMFKPGNFDIDNLENFTTQGISLFMILPIEGEPHQVFNMMHNAARKIAEEFSAQIYDGRRSLLTKQSLQQYVEKIREFERQRSLRG